MYWRWNHMDIPFCFYASLSFPDKKRNSWLLPYTIEIICLNKQKEIEILIFCTVLWSTIPRSRRFREKYKFLLLILEVWRRTFEKQTIFMNITISIHILQLSNNPCSEKASKQRDFDLIEYMMIRLKSDLYKFFVFINSRFDATHFSAEKEGL